ncbi:MAG: FkbM family methyltransferase [Parvularculaceae bacterium]|nr:FkbM family methyltransferase [Parvularculaceae bacterium]
MEPFGTLAPSPVETAFRRAASMLGEGRGGRVAASLLLRAAGGKSGRAFDVPIFGTECARLHPYDNISEKRVFITPQFWEAAERAALASFIASSAGAFTFLDVGANAGLYTLFARSAARAAGRPFRAICIEPSPEMLTRLQFNLDASGAGAEVAIFDCAAGEREDIASFHTNATNRGESRVAAEGEGQVRVRPLAAMIDDAGSPKIDAMKIDIEGSEPEALRGLFASAGPRYRPALIIMELSHSSGDAAALLAAEGYRETFQTKRNGVFERK